MGCNCGSCSGEHTAMSSKTATSLQVATAAFAALDALVEWMSCQLIANLEQQTTADAAARADITAVLRSFAESLAMPRQAGRSIPSSVPDSPMDFERAEREGGPHMKALLWLARSQKAAHRYTPPPSCDALQPLSSEWCLR